jgi:hypothetical protein
LVRVHRKLGADDFDEVGQGEGRFLNLLRGIGQALPV